MTLAKCRAADRQSIKRDWRENNILFAFLARDTCVYFCGWVWVETGLEWWIKAATSTLQRYHDVIAQNIRPRQNRTRLRSRHRTSLFISSPFRWVTLAEKNTHTHSDNGSWLLSPNGYLWWRLTREDLSEFSTIWRGSVSPICGKYDLESHWGSINSYLHSYCIPLHLASNACLALTN